MAKICRCGGATVNKRVTIDRNVHGRRVTIKGVPASVCPGCNERYFSAKTIKHMDRLIAINKESKEINFDLDTKDQCLASIFISMQKSNLISRNVTVDMPATLPDVIYVMDRIAELRHEQRIM